MRAALRLLAAVAFAAVVAWAVGNAAAAGAAANADPLVRLFGKPTVTHPPAVHNGHLYRCSDWWFGAHTVVVVRCFISPVPAASSRTAPPAA